MNDSNNMSVEEVLAACRSMDGSGGSAADNGGAAESAASSESAPVESASASQPSTGQPAEKPAGDQGTGGGKKASEMSVADMLAAARGEKSAAKSTPDAKASPKAAPKPKGKPAAKPAAAKTSPAAKRDGPMDTASILAAARGAAKPGPVSKAEAAAKGEAPAAKTKKKLEVPPMPEKPAYAHPPATPREEASDRRDFFTALAGVFVGSSLAVGFSTLAMTHILWALGLARFMFPNILTEPPTKFKVGFPTDFGAGQVETKYKAQFGVWVVRHEYEGEPQIYALQSVCTHLGCTPNWLEAEQKFKCPCHGSGFYKDGINFEGPAPRPLERFAIQLADDGQLEVDKSRKFLEEKGEWKDAACFVQV